MKKNIIKFTFFVSSLISFISCHKPKVITLDEEREKETIYYSLKLTTNNVDAINYSVNVEDLNKIEAGTKVTITNTHGYYKIVKFLSNENELLSENNSYSFTMDSDKEIKIIFKYDKKYYSDSFLENIKEKEVNIILLAGQSNMEGFDALISDIPVETRKYYKENKSNVVINYNCYETGNYTLGKETSQCFVEVDFGQGMSKNNFGPEVSLAKTLSINDPNTKYIFVKVACGGTTIAVDWNPDNINLTTGKYMYGRFIKNVDSCLDYISTKANYKYTIKAMCWAQGEYDSANNNYANAYNENFAKLTSAIKTRYSEYLSEDFKWISAGISSTGWTYYEKVNEALRNQSDAFIEESITLPKVNSAHYTAQSYLTIGECFGRELLR